MKIIKVIFMVVVTMAITITLTMKYNIGHKDNVISEPHEVKPLPMPVKRVSRFLVNTNNNPRATDQCKKDNDICNSALGGATNSTCCNNKCVDLSTDKNNCGACKNKCKFTDACCGGKCVNLAYDKRHCGTCNNKCMPGGYCIYGMCDYA